MRTIYKFPVSPEDALEVALPEGAKFLHVAEQRPEEVAMWFEVDTDKPAKLRSFTIYGTGHSMSKENQTYLGTFILAGGDLVFHLYELL